MTTGIFFPQNGKTAFVGLVDCAAMHLCPDDAFRAALPDMAAWVDTRRANLVSILEHLRHRPDMVGGLCREVNADDLCALSGLDAYRAFSSQRSGSSDFPSDFPLSERFHYSLKSQHAMRSGVGAAERIDSTQMSFYGGSFLQGCVKSSLLADMRYGRNVAVIVDACVGLGSVLGAPENGVLFVRDMDGNRLALRTAADAEHFHRATCAQLQRMGIHLISTRHLLAHSAEFLLDFFGPDSGPHRHGGPVRSAPPGGAEAATSAL